MTSLRSLCLLGCLLFLATGYSQGEFRRDSIHTDRGISNTLDFEPQSRTYFESYLPDGEPSEIITARQNSMGEWRPVRRRLYTYDNGNLTELLTQIRSADDQEWLDDRRKVQGYNAEGRIVARRIEVAPAPGSPLVNESRRLYTYNAMGEVQQLLIQEWQNGDWEPVRRTQFSYSASGSITERWLQRWNGTEWENRFRRLWEYGPNGFNPTQVISQQWDDEGGEWVARSRRLMSYNAVGFWNGTVEQDWNVETETWENRRREIHPFSGQGQLESYLYQFWAANDWQNGVRETVFRDGLQFGQVVEQWNIPEGAWERKFRYRTTLNTDGLISEELDRQYWNGNTEEWVNDTLTVRRTHFWSEVLSSTQEVPGELLQCRTPNPYRPGMTIRCPDLVSGKSYMIELTDLLGRSRSRTVLNDAGDFALNGNLPAGTYVLRITEGATLHHLQKLVIID